MTAAGWALFGGMALTPKSVLGLLGTFVGAFAYSYIGLAKQQQLQKQSQLPQTRSALPALPRHSTPDAAVAALASDTPTAGAGVAPQTPGYLGEGEKVIWNRTVSGAVQPEPRRASDAVAVAVPGMLPAQHEQ